MDEDQTRAALSGVLIAAAIVLLLTVTGLLSWVALAGAALAVIAFGGIRSVRMSSGAEHLEAAHRRRSERLEAGANCSGIW